MPVLPESPPPDPVPAPARRRPWGVWLALGVVLAAVSYALLWFHLATALKTGVEAWIADRRADGVAIAGLPLDAPRGTLSLDAQLTGPAAAPEGSATVQLRGIAFDDLEPGDLDASLTLDAERLTIEELIWPI